MGLQNLSPERHIFLIVDVLYSTENCLKGVGEKGRESAMVLAGVGAVNSQCCKALFCIYRSPFQHCKMLTGSGMGHFGVGILSPVWLVFSCF